MHLVKDISVETKDWAVLPFCITTATESKRSRSVYNLSKHQYFKNTCRNKKKGFKTTSKAKRTEATNARCEDVKEYYGQTSDLGTLVLPILQPWEPANWRSIFWHVWLLSFTNAPKGRPARMPNLLKEISMNGARLAEDYRRRLEEGLFTTRSKEKFDSDLWLCWEVYYFQFLSVLFLHFTKINPKPLALINVSIEREEKSLAHFWFLSV